MKISALPENESERLAALRSYQILDSETEQDFDGIVQLASQICNAPIALITLIDENRQWFKSKIGLDINETARDVAFCAHTIHENDVMVVPDASQDERFVNNPLVTGEPKIRFYAGMPLITRAGFKLGALCVIDKKPRKLNKRQLNDLRILGKQVINLLDLRIQNLNLNRQVKEKTAEVHEIIERKLLIMDAAIDAIICMDTSGAITFWNPQAEKIFKWKKKEILGKHLADTIIPKQYREQHKNGLAHYLKTGEGAILNKLIEITAVDHDGREFPIELTITPIKQGAHLPALRTTSGGGPDGHTEFFCAYIRDISEGDKAKKELLESKENLERAEEQANMGSWSLEVGSGKSH